MSSDEHLIKAEGVSKLYRRFERPEDRLKQMLLGDRRNYATDFWALKNVSMEVERGETVGIVGRNGSGKSTLLKLICGTIRPTTGTISVRGRVSALLELGAGFNNEFTGRENIKLNASLLGLAPDEIAARMDDILGFADIGAYVDQPVKYYSSGMFARLAFAVAVHVDPQILIIDEILAVGDMAFQRKCIDRIFRIKQQGCTILFVSHDAYQVKTICDRALYLKNGEAIGFGPAKEIVDLYTYDVERSANFISPAIVDAAASKPEPVANNDRSKQSPSVDSQETPTAGKSDNGADTPPYEITSVEMIANGLASPMEIESGAHVEFTVRYRALRKDCPQTGSFVFNLKRHDDFYVCGATTLMEKQPPQELKQEGEFKLTFPCLNILAGVYKIRFAINDDHGLSILAERKSASIFKIRDRYVSDGLVDLKRFWG